MDLIGEKILKEGLWILLEGLALSSKDQEICYKLLNKLVLKTDPSDLAIRFPSPTAGPRGYQVLWLAAQLFGVLQKTSESVDLALKAQYYHFLQELKVSYNSNVAIELLNLLKAVAQTHPTTALQVLELSSEASEFLLDNLLQHASITLALIRSLLSPCLPTLANTDAALTNLCNTALGTVIHTLQEGSAKKELKDTLLILLSTCVTETEEECLPQINSLSNSGTIIEAEIHLALAARGGSPPQLLQAYCNLDTPVLSAMIDSQGKINSKVAFILQNLTGQHWLLNLLELSYTRITNNNSNPSSQTLSTLLAPLLLIHAWDQKLCDEQLIKTLNATCLPSVEDSSLQRIGFLLERRCMVVNWVKEQNKKDNAILESSVINNLQRHSTLRVLHESGCLINAENKEVQNLLNKTNMSNNEDNWESTLYQGYSIMNNVLNLIWISIDADSPSNKTVSKLATYRKMSSQDVSDKSCMNLETTVLFELNKIHNQLEQLHPLQLRLEILENLFSLLFLRYEDLRVDEVASDSGGEDEDDSWKNTIIHVDIIKQSESQLASSSASQTSSPTTIIDKEQEMLPVTNEEIILEREVKTENKINRGFICTPVVIKNILETLRECLVDCTAAFYKQHGIINIDDETPNSQFQRRINTLTQYATEAWWRLQLLTNLTDEERAVKDKYIPEQQRGYPSSASSSDGESPAPAEERRRLERAQRRLSHSSRHSRSDHTDRSSESSSNTTGAGSVASSGGMRVGRRRVKAQHCLPDECDSIVRLMLANPISLALICLEKRDFSKTQQIIQTFQLSKSSLADEVNFLEAYEQMAKTISQGSKQEIKERDYSFSPLNENSPLGVKMVVSSSLETVRKAASAAISAASVTGQVERLLAKAPDVTDLDKITREQRSANNLLCGLNGVILAACDLALTLGATRDTSLSLMDVVSQHWSLTMKDTKTVPRNKNLASFVNAVIELFCTLSKTCKEDSEQGLLNILTNWHFPLALTPMKDHLSLWSTLHESFALFHSEQTSSSKPQVAAVRKMIKICSASYSYHESQGIISSGMEAVSYSKLLFSYLQTLSSLVIKSTDNTEANLSPFVVLCEGWSELLGRLVFDLEAPLGRVERVAIHLQIDLLHATVQACCPTLKLTKNNLATSSSQLPAASAWGKISLNANSSQQSKEDIPEAESLAKSLLSSLISALQACSKSPILTHEEFILASQDQGVLDILNKTTKLSNVDLSSLTQKSEKIAFLCNMTNLLYLHGLLVLGPYWGLASSSWSEKKSAFNSVGYHIGQMGFVPLSGLLKQLCGHDSEQLMVVQDLNDQYWKIEDKRTMFILPPGNINSPVLQVLRADDAGIQLDSAITNYISRSVRVEGSMNDGCYALVITPLILQYLGLSSPSNLDQAEEARDETTVVQLKQFKLVTHMARDCANNLPLLIVFLQRYATGLLQQQLSDWADAWNISEENNTELIVTVEEPSFKFGVVLPSSLEILSTESTQSSFIGGHEEISVVISWESRKLTPNIKQFLEQRCWLVGLLATRLHQELNEFKQTAKTACLDRLLNIYMPTLSPLGNGNVMFTALQPWSLQYQTLWSVLDKLLSEQREAECAQLLLALPEASILSDVKLQTFKDLLLYYMASQPHVQGTDAPWRLALSLGTSELRAQCVLNAIQFWPGAESIDTLKTILGEPTLNPNTRIEVIDALHKITIYQQVHQVLCYYQKNKLSTLGGWHEVCRLSENDPGQVLQSLIDAKQFRLCLPWADLHGIPHRAQHLVDSSFLALLLETETSDFSHAERLLRSVPIAQAISICRRLLGCLTNIASLQFVVKFSTENCTSWLQENPLVWSRLQLWNVGLGILGLVPEQEQARDRALASQPHLLLEQLLMNTRLSTLSSALQILRTADLSALASDCPAHPIVVDAMLRQYATKALDFRVSRRTVPEVKPPADQDELLQSLSTGSTASGSVSFVMPTSAPTKEQWVPNEEVTECMCCLAESFSMFNRRHHCRRCGRVVCGSCSNHRTKVEGYGDLPVRVCDDCSYQMKQQSDGGDKQHPTSEPSSSSSQQTFNMEWKLSGDETHDNTARAEFAFEHAPSVALCLSILGLHSEHAAAQPRFLLEAADRMLLMLVPSTLGYVNPELDYGLVIRMARSLVVAAKVRYAKAALNSGVAHCDRLLGQVDLLALLVRSGCTALLPVESLPLGGHALRHLRDRLVASELWPLALEVSTKAGLERGGVWAAWGKACLRAGRWIEAREHFVHCLQTPVSAQDPSPAPLLSEILRILEETTYTPNPSVMKQAEHIPAPAFSVLHSLAALKDISQGKFPPVLSTNSQPLFISESQYYLRTYGSPSATLAFFLSHSDLTSALNYTIERRIEPDIFAEALYKPCLRQGLIGPLHEELKNIDSTLEMWKKILLHVGRVLERQGLLNSLYQLQLYTHDLVRAAMTCIRFYRAGARCYSDLAPEHLLNARSHLEEELTAVSANQWSSASKGRDSESPSSNPPESPEILPTSSDIQLPLKLPARQLDHHISTICRQLEAAKFLQQCESEGRSVVGIAAELSSVLEAGSVPLIPTLFGNSTERAHLSALVILCGKNVEEGFGITFRIIQDFRLRAPRIYSIAGQWLTSKSQINHIEQLVSCIRSSGSTDSASCSDDLLLHCVHQLAKQSSGIAHADVLLRLIMDPGLKVQAHLACGQLKSAYLLAIKLGRVSDVRAVLSEADRLNQPIMRRICTQWLTQQQKQTK